MTVSIMKKSYLENNSNRVLIIICFITIIFWLFTTPAYLNLIPLESITINHTKFPTFQMWEFFVILPSVLTITYFAFIRESLLSWSEIGFSRGKNGLLSTISYGLIGGIFSGALVYFKTERFLLKEGIAINFFEKCISAPIWEEFAFRVLLFSMFEMLMMTLIEKSKNCSSRMKTVDKRICYVAIILALSFVFSIMHGNLNLWRFTFAIMANLVYYRTRSIIAPSIAHSISNFVSGGFLYLIFGTFN